jgi:hypothetical protein
MIDGGGDNVQVRAIRVLDGIGAGAAVIGVPPPPGGGGAGAQRIIIPQPGSP